MKILMNFRNLLTEITAGLLNKWNIRPLFSVSYSGATCSFSLSVLFLVLSVHTILLCRSFTLLYFFTSWENVVCIAERGDVVAFKVLYHPTVFPNSKSPCCLVRCRVLALSEYHLHSLSLFLSLFSISFLCYRD